MLDTSVFIKGNMGRREYTFLKNMQLQPFILRVAFF
jgi:hypothetical protein